MLTIYRVADELNAAGWAPKGFTDRGGMKREYRFYKQANPLVLVLVERRNNPFNEISQVAYDKAMRDAGLIE